MHACFSSGQYNGIRCLGDTAHGNVIINSLIQKLAILKCTLWTFKEWVYIICELLSKKYGDFYKGIKVIQNDEFAKQQVIHSSVYCQSNKISLSTESYSVLDIRVPILIFANLCFREFRLWPGNWSSYKML